MCAFMIEIEKQLHSKESERGDKSNKNHANPILKTKSVEHMIQSIQKELLKYKIQNISRQAIVQ